MRRNYNKLKDEYPEYISKIQLYQICGISPRSATYLIEKGIIPVIDTGKSTWRYKIRLDDVIAYLRKREKLGSMIPPGSASSRYKRPNNPRKSYAMFIAEGGEQEIAEYYAHIYSGYPDVLTAADIVEMTGLNKSTVLRLLQAGKIKSLTNKPRYFIPKAYLLEFISSQFFIEEKSNSELFKKVLGGFEIWKAAR